jgi:hypothetical protein
VLPPCEFEYCVIIDLCHTLRYLGVPVFEMSQMFGDNKSVVDSATKVHASYTKDTLHFRSIVSAKLWLLGSLVFIISLVLAIQLMC